MGHHAPDSFRAYIERENSLIEFSAQVARELLSRGLTVTWENPPALDEPNTDYFWPERAHLASLWHLPLVKALVKEFNLLKATAPMCMFGSRYLKHFSLLGPPSIASFLTRLRAMRCPGTGDHAQHCPAKGRTAQGESHSKEAGRYPQALSDFILDALASHRSADAARTRQGECSQLSQEAELQSIGGTGQVAALPPPSHS